MYARAHARAALVAQSTRRPPCMHAAWQLPVPQCQCMRLKVPLPTLCSTASACPTIARLPQSTSIMHPPTHVSSRPPTRPCTPRVPQVLVGDAELARRALTRHGDELEGSVPPHL